MPHYKWGIYICQWLPEEQTDQQNAHLNVATVFSEGPFLSAEPTKCVLQLQQILLRDEWHLKTQQHCWESAFKGIQLSPEDTAMLDPAGEMTRYLFQDQSITKSFFCPKAVIC